MLPTETASPEAEAYFGVRLMWFSVVWIVATVLVGVLLVLLAPWLLGIY